MENINITQLVKDWNVKELENLYNQLLDKYKYASPRQKVLIQSDYEALRRLIQNMINISNEIQYFTS